MFKKTFLGDYVWEVNSQISLHFVDHSYKDITKGMSTTTLDIDSISYPLNGDLREEFEATEGDLVKIKKVYLSNIEKAQNITTTNFGPLMRLFTRHIDQYINK